MRLDVLNRGYKPGAKLLFAVIKLVSRQPVPDAAKLVFYRPDFYGSRANECAFCIGAHSATARRAYQDGPKVAAVLADLDSAPISGGLRATLRMLGKLTREGKVGAEDMREVLSAGVSREQVEDALAVCAAFNTTNRLADAFGFEMLTPENFEAGAKYLLKRGYR